jgi:hypothetical protein
VGASPWRFESSQPHHSTGLGMHSREVVAEVLKLREAEGIGPRRIARRTGLPLGTIRDWLAGKLPKHSLPGIDGIPPNTCATCGHDVHDFGQLPPAYVYLLGLYLGDGCISAHRRGVFRLRIALDAKYPGIIAEAGEAIAGVMPGIRVLSQLTPSNYVSVSAYSKSWPCLFPQHGPGLKHRRPIFLAEWQERLVLEHPELLLRGLIQSDGCRFTNTRGKSDSWSAPRYSFSQVSEDIKQIFCDACDLLGLRWTVAPRTVYVSRKADVARLDEFVGPKA